MSIRAYIILSILGIAASNACIADIWVNSEDALGANFPAPPSRVDVDSAQVSGYSYQSVRQYDGGGALYAITVVPLLLAKLKVKPAKFLEDSNNSFLISMGVDPLKANVKWNSFGSDRQRLSYETDFNYDGLSFHSLGFWIIDGNRAIRVSVAYTESSSHELVAEIESFLDSFFIVSTNN